MTRPDTDGLGLTLFIGPSRAGQGNAGELASLVRAALERGEMPLVFDDATGRAVDIDPRDPAPERPRGRPKLGVTAREVTLLPRHWDWLTGQRGGASAALRRLVETAMRADLAAPDPARAREAAYRVATALAGDLPGYEEAMRHLFAGNRAGFTAAIAGWPADIRAYLTTLAEPGTE